MNHSWLFLPSSLSLIIYNWRNPCLMRVTSIDSFLSFIVVRIKSAFVYSLSLLLCFPNLRNWCKKNSCWALFMLMDVNWFWQGHFHSKTILNMVKCFDCLSPSLQICQLPKEKWAKQNTSFHGEAVSGLYLF